jgi:hypothetical protein
MVIFTVRIKLHRRDSIAEKGGEAVRALGHGIRERARPASPLLLP